MTPLVVEILAHASETPENPAVVVGNEILSYGGLADAVDHLSMRLVAAGALPGTVIAVHLEQSTATVVAMLAAARVGAAWAVVEPGQPAARLAAVVRDTDCRVLVHAGSRPASADTLAHLDVRDLVAAPPVPLPPTLPLDLPAYVIHTSGSTGRPKGVVVGHAHLDTSIRCRDVLYGTGRPTFLTALRLSFDGSLGATLWTLRRGGTVVLPDEERMADPGAVATLAATRAVTHLICVPSYYRLLLDHAALLPPTLRHVSVGGERCEADLVRRHRRLLPTTGLVNEYGPTEAIVSCTYQRVPPHHTRGDVPIGAPLPGARVHVLDAALREQPAGGVGELYVGGPFLAQGYAGQPSRTAERFVADPFAALPGARLYRTGDLATRRPDGALEFRGRADDQVKIRGHRVEPAEVAEVVSAHPAVRRAAVLLDPLVPEPVLVAYLVCDGPLPPPVALRALCRESLPLAAVPARFVAVPAIPLTVNGKLDRDALARLGAAQEEDRVDAPADHDWTGLQRAVADIWAEVLGHRGCGLQDNFFDAGGTSLKVVDLHKRLERRWPGAVRVGELFDAKTIAAQAAVIAGRADTPVSDRSGPPPAAALSFEV
ncbi:non-ribosomal peptide synthetase [Micromonospora endolithica]|uniref:Amino acid adenylation domain-containing protein n=1 Tax=Micromonospora endolithica TaxID=230091 RepID=A0A3A9ZAG0_9ACTN|nr:non-ribosomal peptide synthetase [Micromonospora endolithica]RKN45341.1 amino acid adenylation domain-containing protein [Micromonospora endolithica]TWJ22961.1 amino acid adenylation domain-containing protein [Micromonospora endolithica]